MKLHKFGPYQTEELLGRGGMGTVYRGVHEQTRQVVALKVLSFIHADDDNFRERFGLEIETLKKLRHPHIVELYGYGVQDGHLFYAMELIQGNSLQQELDSGRRFDWRETTQFSVAICQALKHAHDRGVIHRDLKPANLLLTEDNQIKLSDFGIAKLFGAHQITADRSVIGTADYMAPEQAEGSQANARSDLYSLGSVMYALTTGKPPFASSTLAKVLSDLRHTEPIPLSRQVPQVPPEFDDIVMHLLQKEPEKRMATALALAKHLRAMEHAINRKATVEQEPTPESAQTKFSTQADGQPHAVPADSDSADTRSLSPTVEAPQFAPNELSEAAGTVEASSPARQSLTRAEILTSDDTEQPVDQFTQVDPNRPMTDDQDETEDSLLMTVSKISLSVILIALLVVGGWYMLKPANEAQLYERIKAAAQNDDPDALIKSSAQIEAFLDRFPDSPHFAQVKEHQRDIELQRVHRSFEQKTRNTRVAGKMSASARAYLQALQKSRTDQEGAAVQMQAVIDLFSGMPDKEAQQYVELAKADLASLNKQIEQRRKDSLQLLNSRLQDADKLSKTDPEAAQTIYRAIVILYADKPWAAAIVDQARQRQHP